MANLTLSIDDELLKRARIKALEQGTSVNAIVREQLNRYAGAEDQAEARRRIIASARRSQAGSGPAGRSWTREELYEERMSRHGHEGGRSQRS